jgi:hypothetical protein
MAAENALIVERHQTFFEVTDDEHSAAEIQQGVTG